MGTLTITDHVSSPLIEVDGSRPIDLNRDLPALADLMEIGFGRELDEGGRAMLREMRMLGRTSWLLHATNALAPLLGGLQEGYVWLIDGKIIGNVSTMPMSAAQSGRPTEKGAIVANVVVHPDYRRQGIAASLLRESLADIRRRGVTFAELQVVADNTHALDLYRAAGFRPVRTFTAWARPARLSAPPPIIPGVGLPEVTLRAGYDWRAEYQLADRARPNSIGRLGWLRPTVPRAFNPGWLTRIGSWLVAQGHESWTVYAPDVSRQHRDRSILGVARLAMAFGSPDQIDLLVDPALDPAAQRQIARVVLRAVLQRLNGRTRPIATEHPTDDVIGAPALAEVGFEARWTKTTMQARLDSGGY